MNARNLVLAVGIAWVACGCGGTTTTDGASAYNRGPSSGAVQANSATLSPAVSSVVVRSESVANPELAKALFAQLKKLSPSPVRIFLLGATLQAATAVAPLAKVSRIAVVPVPGGSVSDWEKVVKQLEMTKTATNGPSLAKPNVDGLTSDQSKLSYTFSAEGVRFFVVNTSTPISTKEPAMIPRLWLASLVEKSREKVSIVIGYKPLRPATEKDLTPTLPKMEDAEWFGKSGRVKLFVAAAAASDMGRPESSGVYQLTVGQVSEKPAVIGVIEVQSGRVVSKLVDLSNIAGQGLQATLYDPVTLAKPEDKAGAPGKIGG